MEKGILRLMPPYKIHNKHPGRGVQPGTPAPNRLARLPGFPASVASSSPNFHFAKHRLVPSPRDAQLFSGCYVLLVVIEDCNDNRARFPDGMVRM